MQRVTDIDSMVIPLGLDEVDTDQIIPAAFLTSVSREGYGQNLFRGLRDADPNFVMNDPCYAQAQILIAGRNFGCGSSREHAVWAILGRGIRVVIAKSFADIFSGNSANNGLLLVKLPEQQVDQLLATARREPLRLRVSLEQQSVVLPDGSAYQFDYDPFRKHCLLQGLDDIDYIRSRSTEIAEFRQQQRAHRFLNSL